MKPLLAALAIFGLGCAPAPAPKDVGSLVDLADPTIGTGGFGFAYGASFLGAAAPHGLAKAGPDTTGDFGEIRFVHTSGNWAEDKTILCFSHTHLQGTGVPDGGALALMPTASFDPQKPRAVDYQATRAGEETHPGTYAVHLVEPGIDVELAAPDVHTTSWRVTYPAGGNDNVVVVDLHRVITEGNVTAAHYTVDGARLHGSMHVVGSLSPPGGYDVYFAVDANAPFTALDTGFGAALSFGAVSPVELHVGLSYVDEAGAVKNLDAELPATLTHDQAKQRAHDAWAALLDRVSVSVLDDNTAAAKQQADQAVVFASALYRSFLMPTVMSDVDGRWRGPPLADVAGARHNDGAIHDVAETPGLHRMMTDLSLWDTYRTLAPLYALVAPEDARDQALSIAAFTSVLGHGPLWPMATGDAGVMIGSPGEIVLADALARGAVTPDEVAPSYAILRAAALDDDVEPAQGRGGRSNVVAYDKNGGWAVAPARAPVSTTLEYADADQALGRIAQALGHVDDDAKLTARSHGWRTLFDPDTGFLRAKNPDGSFVIAASDFAPEHFSDDYVEADAWQQMFPLDDVPGVLDAYGDVNARIRDLLAKTQAAWSARDPADIAPPSFHWQGNEPSLHVSWLPYQTGDDELASNFVSWVMDNEYTRGTDGIPGNDDGGALSSWYVLAAMGLFPVPGSGDWVVGAAAFPVVDVHGVVTVHAPDDAFAARTRRIDHATLVGAP